MAEKASGKSQGRSRPQAQAKGQTKERQGKQGSAAGRGGGGGARPAANGTAARRGGEQRGQQGGRANQERSRPRAQEQEERQQEQPASGGAGGKVGDTIKQHPLTTAALGAGLTLLAAQGLRMALGGSTDNGGAQGRGGEAEDEDSSSQGSFLDSDEGEEGEEEDDDAGSASASGEEDEEDADDEGEEGSGFTSRLRQGASRVGSALGSSGNAIRRGAESGFQRGRQAADQSWATHPLVMCGVALAVGAAAGLILPKSRQEDRLMGKAADKVTGRFKKAMTESFRQGRTVAGKVVHEAVNATAKEAEREGLTPERLGKKVKRLVSHVRDAVSNAVEEE